MTTFAISRPVGKRISREHFFEFMKLILVAFIILLLTWPVYGQQKRRIDVLGSHPQAIRENCQGS